MTQRATILTITQAANILECEPHKVARLCESGALRHEKIGDTYYVYADAVLERLLQSSPEDSQRVVARARVSKYVPGLLESWDQMSVVSHTVVAALPEDVPQENGWAPTVKEKKGSVLYMYGLSTSVGNLRLEGVEGAVKYNTSKASFRGNSVSADVIVIDARALDAETVLHYITQAKQHKPDRKLFVVCADNDQRDYKKMGVNEVFTSDGLRYMVDDINTALAAVVQR